MRTSLDKKLVANLAFVGLTRLVPRLATPLLTIAAAKILSPAGYGGYVAAAALTAIVTQLLEGGVNQLITRDIAANRSQPGDYAMAAVLLKLVLLVPVGGLVAITAAALHYPGPVRAMVYLLTVGVFIGSFGNVFDAMLQGWQRMSQVAIAVTAMSLTNVAVGIPLLVVWRNPFALVVAAAAGYAAYSAICIVMATRVDKYLLRLRPNVSFLSRFLKDGAWFSVAQLASPLYSRGDAVILAAVGGVAAAGVYGLAYSALMLLVLPAEIIVTTIYPRLSARWRRVAPATTADDASVAISAFAVLGAAAGLGGYFLGPHLLRALVPHGFWGVGAIIATLSLSAPWMYLNRSLDAIVRIKGLLHAILIATLCSLMVNFSSNVILDSPRFLGLGAEGAAISMVLSEVTYAIVVGLVVFADFRRPAALAVRIASIGFGTGVVGMWLGSVSGRDQLPIGPLAGTLAVVSMVGISWRQARLRLQTLATRERDQVEP